MISSLALLVIVVILGARAFGELIVEAIKTIIAAVRTGNPSLMAQIFLNIMMAVVAILVIVNTWENLLPTEGVTYVLIPALERLADWLVDTLNALLHSH